MPWRKTPMRDFAFLALQVFNVLALLGAAYAFLFFFMLITP